jgi:hypothetical protein
MTKLLKAALIVAALGVLAGGAMQLNSTAAVAQRSPAIQVPSQCTSSRMQIPTTRGLVWDEIIACPTSE